MWNVAKVKAIMNNNEQAATFLCGGSRNSERSISLFARVIVLEIDAEALERRLAARPRREWGGTASEGESFAREQQATRLGLPVEAVLLDATAPLACVVHAILQLADRHRTIER